MRTLSLTLLTLILAGCAAWLPRHDPAQAWVDLDAAQASQVQATDVDEQQLDDPRFFQVAPGSHRLGVRYLFEVGAHNIGRDAPALQRDCRLALEYAGFEAGERYRLAAGATGFRPWARLYGSDGRLLAQADERGCLRG